MDETTDNEYSGLKPSKTWKTIKLVLKYVLVGVIVFIYLFFTLRYCTSKPEQRILWTNELKTAYEQNKDSFRVYTQSPHVFIDDNGYMVAGKENESLQIAVFNILYIPSAKELQVTVRYNKNVYEKLAESYNLTKSIDTEPFIYSLLLEDGIRITDYRYSGYETSRYFYRYLVFDNVELEEYTPVKYTPQDAAVTDAKGNIIAHETDENGYSVLYETDENGMAKVYKNKYAALDIYYIDDVNFNESPDSSLIVFDRTLGFSEFNYKKYMPEEDSELPLMNKPIYEDKTPR